MAERESEVVSTSGFKVRPLSKREPGTVNHESETSESHPQPLITKPDKQKESRLRELTNELRELEAKLRLGGGGERVDKQHKQGKLTARERIDLLLDRDSFSQEIGLLVAYDQYKSAGAKGKGEKGNESETGSAPAAGVVTTVGRVSGREVVVVANDADRFR